MNNSCKTCKFSRWSLTSGGRIRRHNSGICTYRVVLPMMPACMVNVSSMKCGVWPNDGKECPVFDENEGQPIAIGGE